MDFFRLHILQYLHTFKVVQQMFMFCFRQSGALGSRLTGAGWGGCAVSLVPANQLSAFLEKVTEGYYKKTQDRMSKLADSLFATKPGQGAAIYTSP